MSLDPSSLTPDWQRVFERVWAERRKIAVCVVVGLLLATLYNYSFRPIYESVAVVSVRETMSGGGRKETDNEKVAEVVERETGQLRSPEFIHLVVDTLSEADRAELASGALSSWFEKVQAEWSRRVGEPRVLTPAETADALQSRLVLFWREPSTWVEVRVRAYDPQAAARIANAILNQYVIGNDRRNQERAAGSTEELDRVLAAGKDRLGSRLNDLKIMAETSTTGDLDSKRRMLQQQERGFLEALVAAQTALAGRTATQLKAAQGAAGQSSSRNDPQLSAARARVTEMEERERSLLASLGERHPDVLLARDQLGSARRLVSSLRESLQQETESQYKLALREEARLQAQVQRIRSDLVALDSQSVDYSLSKRKAEMAKVSLDAIVLREQVEADTLIQVQVVQAAYPSSVPVDPQKRTNSLAGALIGLVSGLLLVYGGDQFQNAVRMPDDFRKIHGLRFLGAVPMVHPLRPEALHRILTDAKTGFGDSLRVVRTNLTYVPNAKRPKVIVVTSASPHDGKSTIATALGVLMKETTARVLLIDADLRRPTLHEAFGVPLLPGLSQMLSAAGVPELQVRPTKISGLDLITAGKPQALSSALSGSEAMTAVLDQARARYDWVIVDAPPALALPDAAVLTTQADGAIIVCSAESTRLHEIYSVVEQIQAIGGTVIGAVLNRVDMRRHSYYYARSYSSYYGAADVAKETGDPTNGKPSALAP